MIDHGEVYSIVSDNTPPLISDLASYVEREPTQPKKTQEGYSFTIFNTFHENSMRFKGAVLWNFVSDYLNDSHI